MHSRPGKDLVHEHLPSIVPYGIELRVNAQHMCSELESLLTVILRLFLLHKVDITKSLM